MKAIGTIFFTYFFILVLTLFFFLIVPQAYANGRPCGTLVHELNQMKNAQNQIVNSLAQNHDTFADQLSDLSFELALYKKTVPRKALEAMEKSAQAYRVRSHKAQETAQRLDDMTESLIARVQRCLK